MRTRAAQELQQQRLGLVVGVVRERDEVGVDGGERRVARRARRGFEAHSAAALDPRAMHDERDVALRAFGRAECRPRVGVGGQAVVDVQRGELDAMFGRDAREGVEERDRIASAGKRDGDAGRARPPSQRSAAMATSASRTASSTGASPAPAASFIVRSRSQSPPAPLPDQPAGISLNFP